MKKTRGRPTREEFKPKIYTPHQEFKDHFKDLLHLLRKDGDPKSAEGIDEHNIRRMRNYYLNRIFQAMADLTFFFESISTYPELQQEFESDIKELLGIRRNSPTEDNYAFVFRRLIHSIFFLSQPRENDFTLRLANQLQQIIYSKLKRPLYEFFKENSEPKNMVLLDIGRAKAWTELIAQTVNDEYNFDIQSNEKYGDTEKKRLEIFNKKATKPARTFQLDKKKLLED